MKKITVIGDIHGRDNWKKAIQNGSDLYIFIGDYVDSYDLENLIILHNLNEIINFKKDNPDKVVLLIGNHDGQYIYFPDYRCSGFRPEMKDDIYKVFHDNENLFKAAHSELIGGKDYLFSHAGVSNKWFKKYKSLFSEIAAKLDLPEDDYAEIFNVMLEKQTWRDILFEIGEIRGGMRYDNGGITWADKTETMAGIPSGMHQVVGHTPVQKIETYNKIMGTISGGSFFILQN